MTPRSAPADPVPARGVAPFFAPLQREFDRVLADFSGFDLSEMFGPSPRIDLRELDGAIKLTAGVQRDKIQASLKQGVLAVTAPVDPDTATRKTPIRIDSA